MADLLGGSRSRANGDSPQPTPPARSGLVDWLANFGDWQWPLGALEMGPGGTTLNDLLVPLADTRAETDRVLPETLSLNDIGRALQYLGGANLTEEHLRAINEPADPDEPRSAIRRLLGLFPAAGAEGGAVAPAATRGSTTLGAAFVRSADQMPPRLPTEGFGSVFPQPQRLLDPNAPDYTPGGRYLQMPERTDITGTSPAQAAISVGEGGKPSFRASQEVREAPTKAEGAKVKTNLFKQSAGWKWAQRNEGVPDTPTLVSVETGGKHYYTLSAEYPSGVNLTRYPDARSEPRLRPTTHGDVELGPQVGTITVRGREHPVYERAVVVPKAAKAGGSPPPARPVLLTPEPDQPLLDAARRHFGVTRDPAEAGYVLPDGTLLDMSGRHEATGYQRQGDVSVPERGRPDYLAGQRNVDHREIGDFVAGGGTDAMIEFMRRGRAARHMPGIGFETSFVPTDTQMARLVQGHRRATPDEPLKVDYSHPQTGEVLETADIDRPTVDKVRQFYADAAAKHGFYAKSSPTNALLGAVLDMSPEARAARAAEQGYNLDAYHSTKADFDHRGRP
jgi:hypothetical protein